MFSGRKFEVHLTMMGCIIRVFILEYPLEQRYFLEYIQEYEIDAGSQLNQVQFASKKLMKYISSLE